MGGTKKKKCDEMNKNYVDQVSSCVICARKLPEIDEYLRGYASYELIAVLV